MTLLTSEGEDQILCFILVYIMWLLVQGPAQPLVAQLGGSIILPCSVETPLPMEELEVEWKTTDEEALVHLFQNGEYRPEAQHQSYRDRALFFSEQIFKGNFSILLENITVADTGIYRCVVFSYQNVGEISVTIQDVCSAHHYTDALLYFPLVDFCIKYSMLGRLSASLCFILLR
uniref:Ig-like domain-containing protein n=1 Tax=Sinocyclocheilus rhinocerous TaxID=307959 RepID=A0A673JFN6_9TELE